ncbi:kinase-like domain-containing protein [Mycena albidolilacea]|uniref:Kinase-like domain-containing protein n=1 Tax=Mycena albidolilacea TaxID=1033008 RepID=A0AAD6ZH34_9AGAR|nr:kinase-like domain-containing protein [Mycena albidolilacea]
MQNTIITPCQYRTGKMLGSGTYAIVREATHIHTGRTYACKIINKQLMEGREYLVRNEIAVLKRISKGHPNIVTLHDYFESTYLWEKERAASLEDISVSLPHLSPRNLYLCFGLCTGGELFDRICSKGNYYEADAAALVRTILTAVNYIHTAGIVHRDLKPENLLFRTEAADADIMIADFGLSRVLEEEKLSLLTGVCGTPGYMAPEIFKNTGHGKPVDVWAMGVITYFLLAGYTPFDQDSPEAETAAIVAGNYKFEPAEYWANVSGTARGFVQACLTVEPARRPTAAEALEHRWLASATPHFVPDPFNPSGATDLLPHVKKAFNAKLTWKKAGHGIRALKRMSALASSGDRLSQQAAELSATVQRFKEESAQEVMEDASITHHHNLQVQ